MAAPDTRRPRLRQAPVRRPKPADITHQSAEEARASTADPVATLLSQQLGNGAALAWWHARGSTPLQLRADTPSEVHAEALGQHLRGLTRHARQRTRTSTPSVSPTLAPLAQAHIATALAQPGEPLPSTVQRQWAARTHADLSGIQVHHNAAAAQAAASIGARAFAFDRHIVFGANQYQPHTAGGERLLAHELGHVVAHRGAAPVIERDDGVETDEEGRIVITITAPPSVWFTFMDGHYLVRVQSDYVAYDLMGMSLEAVEALWWARRRPDIADPRLPAETFIRAIESETGLTFLPEARAAVLARGPLPMRLFGDTFYAIDVDDADLVRWFGPTQWAEYMALPEGGGGRPTRRRTDERAASSAVDPEAAAIAEPINAHRRVLASNAGLSALYLLLLEHFTGLEVSRALDRQARDGLDASELAPLLAADIRRAAITDLFTQGWVEFREAGGSDLMRFEPLIERILEQYLRGNITARANLLRIGRAFPEREVLGIAHRRSGLLLYDDMGLPMQGLAGIALRDVGFIGYEPPGMAPAVEGAGEEPTETLTESELGDALVRNLFSQALGVDDTVMIAQAAQTIFNNLERVAHEVEDDLSEEIRDAIGPTLFVLAAFMMGHATARLMMRSPNPVAIAIGVALEGMLRIAGYIMGLEFLGQTLDVLLRAAFHMSRVHNDADGNPTRLSELHIRSAARPLATLITNIAIAMGIAALGASLRRVRSGGARGVIDNPADGLREVGLEGRVEPGAPEAARPPVTRSLRPGFTARLRARLLGAVMRGMVEAAPITGGTGGGIGGPLGEPIAGRAPRVTVVEPPRSTPVEVTTPEVRAPEVRAPEASAPAAAAPAIATPEVAAPAMVAPEVAAPVLPAAPATATPVWVNTRSGVFHRAGSRWYGTTAQGEYMSEADALARGHTEAGAARAMPPSSVYEVTRPALGEPRVVIRAWIEERSDRAGLEHEMMSAAEYGIAELEGYHRAHSTGAGLGAESGAAIRLAPGELVNQAMQRRGIEGFIRALADAAMEEGVRIHLTTETRTHSGTLRLASIHYAVEAATPEGRISLFDAAIEVRTNGQARAGVRMAGSDTYTFGPWFAE